MPDVDLTSVALCSLEDVNNVLVQDGSQPLLNPGSEHARLIVMLINAMTKSAEGASFIGQELEYKARKRFWNVPADRDLIVHLDAPIGVADVDVEPPPLLVRVWSDPRRVFGDETELDIWDDFIVNQKTGLLQAVELTSFKPGVQALKVEWTGGLIVAADPPENGAAMTLGAVPDDLRLAAAMQVGTWYRRRKDYGIDTISQPGGGVLRLTQDPSKYLSGTMDVYGTYRRFRSVC